jgi:hypothetical protein
MFFSGARALDLGFLTEWQVEFRFELDFGTTFARAYAKHVS